MNRRDFLRSSSVPIAGAVLGVTSATAKGGQVAPPSEPPAFMALVAALDVAKADHIKAERAKADALAVYRRLRPDTPPDLVETGLDDRWGFRGELEYEPGEPPRFTGRRILLADDLGKWATAYGPRTKLARDLRRRQKLAVEYEAGLAAAREAARVDPLISQSYFAANDLIQAAYAVCEADVSTPIGVAHKARAWLTMIDVDRHSGNAFVSAPKLAADVIRICGEGLS